MLGSRYKKLMLMILSVLLLGCGNDITRLSDEALRQKIHSCDYAVGLSTAEHQACENYRRECKRRLNDGRFVCN